MKTILLSNTFYAPDALGGAELSTQQLAEELTNHFDVHVLTTGGHRGYVTTDRVNGVTVHRLPNANLYWPGMNGSRSVLEKARWHVVDTVGARNEQPVRRIIEALEPVLVHTQNVTAIGSNIWVVAAARGIPVVHTLRDESLLRPTRLPPLNSWIRNVHRQRSSSVNLAIGLTEHSLGQHVAAGLFPKAAQEIVPNAIDIPCFRRALPVSGAPMRIGVFGQLSRNKGVDVLIEAVKTLSPGVVREVIIAGDGPEGDALKSLAGNDDRFSFVGRIPPRDAYMEMARVDVVVLPTRWHEAFGRPTIEAAAQGTLVIASAVGGIPDVVAEPKYLFPAGSVRELRSLLLRRATASMDEIRAQHDRSLHHAARYRSNIKQHLAAYASLISHEAAR